MRIKFIIPIVVTISGILLVGCDNKQISKYSGLEIVQKDNNKSIKELKTSDDYLKYFEIHKDLDTAYSIMTKLNPTYEGYVKNAAIIKEIYNYVKDYKVDNTIDELKYTELVYLVNKYTDSDKSLKALEQLGVNGSKSGVNIGLYERTKNVIKFIEESKVKNVPFTFEIAGDKSLGSSEDEKSIKYLKEKVAKDKGIIGIYNDNLDLYNYGAEKYNVDSIFSMKDTRYDQYKQYSEGLKSLSIKPESPFNLRIDSTDIEDNLIKMRDGLDNEIKSIVDFEYACNLFDTLGKSGVIDITNREVIQGVVINLSYFMDKNIVKMAYITRQGVLDKSLYEEYCSDIADYYIEDVCKDIYLKFFFNDVVVTSDIISRGEHNEIRNVWKNFNSSISSNYYNNLTKGFISPLEEMSKLADLYNSSEGLDKIEVARVLLASTGNTVNSFKEDKIVHAIRKNNIKDAIKVVETISKLDKDDNIKLILKPNDLYYPNMNLINKCKVYLCELHAMNGELEKAITQYKNIESVDKVVGYEDDLKWLTWLSNQEIQDQ